jgi:hypothetical protein
MQICHLALAYSFCDSDWLDQEFVCMLQWKDTQYIINMYTVCRFMSETVQKMDIKVSIDDTAIN